MFYTDVYLATLLQLFISSNNFLVESLDLLYVIQTDDMILQSLIGCVLSDN